MNTMYTITETLIIAKKVSQTLAIALELAEYKTSSVKVKQVDVNSFEITAIYEDNDWEDEFSFYIKDDKLHLIDFTFDKILVDALDQDSLSGLLCSTLLLHFTKVKSAKLYRGCL